MHTDDGTWQTKAEIPEKERYGRYLASREWAERKRPVKERSGGTCERCKVNKSDAVHHLTYERKYAELPEDLQDICEACHKFTHGKSDEDPIDVHRMKTTLDVLDSLRTAITAYSRLKSDWDKPSRLIRHAFELLAESKTTDQVVVIAPGAECRICGSRNVLMATHAIENNATGVWCRRCLYLQLHEIEGPDEGDPREYTVAMHAAGSE